VPENRIRSHAQRCLPTCWRFPPAGSAKIHHDETRHIGYGMWFLRETVRSDPEMRDVVRQTLRDLLPSVAASLAPPDTGSDRDFAAIGASSEDGRAFALDGLTRALRSSACL
jgi:ribonucleoside-diphosphate reductase beta chain